jgi:hypothetical protein
MTLPININNENEANPPSLKALFGDKVAFRNEADSPKIIRFVEDSITSEFYPLGFLIQPGETATVITVLPKPNAPEQTISYRITDNESIADGPDDDTYTVVVGSGGNENR